MSASVLGRLHWSPCPQRQSWFVFPSLSWPRWGRWQLRQEAGPCWSLRCGHHCRGWSTPLNTRRSSRHKILLAWSTDTWKDGNMISLHYYNRLGTTWLTVMVWAWICLAGKEFPMASSRWTTPQWDLSRRNLIWRGKVILGNIQGGFLTGSTQKVLSIRLHIKSHHKSVRIYQLKNHPVHLNWG